MDSCVVFTDEGASPKKNHAGLYAVVAIIAVTAGYFGYSRYAESSAEKAVIAYACDSDVIEKTTAIITEVQNGISTGNFGQQTIESMYARGLRMAQETQPIAQGIRMYPDLVRHKRYFGALLKKTTSEKSGIYLAVAGKVSKECPLKSPDMRITAEAVAMIIGSAAK
jgi:hypothetical protein